MLIIEPSVLEGTVQVPSSKSMGHRMMICAALANGKSKIYNVNMSKDLEATKAALESLGASFEQIDDVWYVKGIEWESSVKQSVEMYCRESGSTLRFMIPIASGLVASTTFEGQNQLTTRPIDEYFETLSQSDVHITYDGKLPLKLDGRYKGGAVQLFNTKSSQYISGLLMAAPILEEGIHIEVNGNLESKAYVSLTIEAMAQFGVMVENHYDETRDIYQYVVNKNERYEASEVAVEGDYSQAAFWIVAGLLGKRPLRLTGLRKDSLQGDAKIIELIQSMGGVLKWEEDALTVWPSKTQGCTIDASQIPDIVPILGILAAKSSGVTKFVNAERLRIKESDRIKATMDILNKFGVKTSETEDGFMVYGSWEQVLCANEVVDAWNDHRIAMAASIAAITSKSVVRLTGEESVTKSYPHFFEALKQLGGNINGQYIW